MTQNDKEILLQDISGRIPYHPLMFIQSSSSDKYKSRFNVRLDSSLYDSVLKGECEAIPYLFPMSHLTDEQCREIEFLAFSKRYGEIIGIYNRYNIDYRGMLERKLAINASNLLEYSYG
jgi:hypothetical protein